MMDLTAESTTIVIINHSDIPFTTQQEHGIDFLAIFQDMTQSHLMLHPDSHGPDQFICDFLLKKRSGIVSKERLLYRLSSEGTIVAKADRKTKPVADSKPPAKTDVSSAKVFYIG
ncbi:hypothetical protein HDU91_000319 [Kappamyces sp. JEL0680]|nr:hypothetical protein HDU91_000319 [Kappamyces sp. JEL0680]